MTDYKGWTDFALAAPVINTEPYWLYVAVSSPDDDTGELFECKRTANGGFVVKAGATSDALYLTGKSQAAMLNYIREKYMDGMDPESWFGMKEAESKDD